MRVPALSITVALASVVLSAQVPVNNEPHHRTVYENADFRILDVRVSPGSRRRTIATITTSRPCR
jgi:hypothetical protein